MSEFSKDSWPPVVTLGPGRTLQRVDNSDGTVYGFIETHPRPDNGQPCEGGIALRTAEVKHPSWVVESVDPITLSPSILCKGCGTHGFVTDGKWVTA